MLLGFSAPHSSLRPFSFGLYDILDLLLLLTASNLASYISLMTPSSNNHILTVEGSQNFLNIIISKHDIQKLFTYFS